MKSDNTVIIVSLYRPKVDEIKNLYNYCSKTEKCIIMDDSENCNEELCFLYLKDKRDRFDYVWNHGNMGLSRSLNIGIDKAKQIGANWILFMDSDSRWQNDILEVYKEYITNHDMSMIALLGPQHNYSRHIRRPKAFFKEKKRIMLSGCLMSVEAINRIGGFDENFFIDGLDYDWCYRARMKGYRIIECGEAVINHSPGIERQLKFGNRVILKYGWAPPDRYYYQFKSMRIMHDKYHDILIDIHAIYKPLKVLFLFENKIDYIIAWNKAKKDYKKGYFGKCPILKFQQKN